MVPSEEPWPESIWGLKLGYRVHNIRYRGDFVNDRPEYRTLLEDIGFRCDRIKKGTRKKTESLEALDLV
jgi:hypothetical protein